MVRVPYLNAATDFAADVARVVAADILGDRFNHADCAAMFQLLVADAVRRDNSNITPFIAFKTLRKLVEKHFPEHLTSVDAAYETVKARRNPEHTLPKSRLTREGMSAVLSQSTLAETWTSFLLRGMDAMCEHLRILDAHFHKNMEDYSLLRDTFNSCVLELMEKFGFSQKRAETWMMRIYRDNWRCIIPQELFRSAKDAYFLVNTKLSGTLIKNCTLIAKACHTTLLLPVSFALEAYEVGQMPASLKERYAILESLLEEVLPTRATMRQTHTSIFKKNPHLLAQKTFDLDHCRKRTLRLQSAFGKPKKHIKKSVSKARARLEPQPAVLSGTDGADSLAA